MNLSDLKPGEKAFIVKIRGRGSFRKRLTEMGFVKGKQIEYLQQAPLNDPVIFKIMGFEVSLRKSEAFLVEIEYVPNKDNSEITTIQTFELTEDIPVSIREKTKHIHIALVGNPNCGKTTLFNYCTGLSEHVGNYSGVTVDLKTGNYKYKDYTFEITDLPGTYSLSAYSPEELYVRHHLMNEFPDVIINVVDSSNIERNLYLTTQLIDMDLRVVIALNMYDELEQKGDKFQYEKMGAMLGIPMIPTVSSRGRGIIALFNQVIDLYEDKNSLYRHIHINYGENIESSISKIQVELKKNKSLLDKYSSRFIALKLLENDKEITKIMTECNNLEVIQKVTLSQFKKLEKDLGETAETIIADAKYGFIEGALLETYKKNPTPFRKKSRVIDKILINKWLGFPIFLLFLWLTFEGTFIIGEYPVLWIKQAVELLHQFLETILPLSIFKDLLLDGVIQGVGGVLVFLPNILLLFFFIALMEDTGYMARAAFIMDKLMHGIGLHGKSFIPLFMGFGCNVPAIMATRTIESRTDRLVTMLINPLMSCSARLPIYILIVGTFFSRHAGSVIFLIYITGIVLAALLSLFLKKVVFKKSEVPFVMELPSYRIPTFRNIFRHMWQKAKQYLKKMSGVILIASIIIWSLSYFPTAPHTKSKLVQIQQLVKTPSLTNFQREKLTALYKDFKYQTIKNSYLSKIGRWVEPVMTPLGFDWRITVSLMAGITGKEVVVSTLAVLFNGDELSQNTFTLNKSLLKATKPDGTQLFTIPVVFAFLIFILVYFPCIATIVTIKKESGYWKWAIYTVLFSSLLAWLLALLIKIVATWLL